MLDPTLDRNRDKNVHFRKSMRKFKGVQSNTFSIVEHSVPYVYTRLNNDIVTLLSALGVTDEVLKRKLEDYLSWLDRVPTDLPTALDFLSSTGRHDEVEKILLEGFDSPKMKPLLKGALKKELDAFKKMDTEKDKLRILIHDSRFVFGVCDPYQVLEEGEVFIQVTMPKDGPRAIHSCPVLVVRNPCLHPGK
jgi:regulator of nonsense transcripts 1